LDKGLGWDHVVVDKLGAIVCLLPIRDVGSKMCHSKRRCPKVMVSQWNERDWEATASESRGESSREQPQTTLA
jgi:hypothetical protein